MTFNDSIPEALERVLSWDLPDEACSTAFSAEAGHLAGFDSEQQAADD